MKTNLSIVMKRTTKLLLLVPVALATVWIVSTSRAATETPDYTTVRKDEKFEIRDYPSLTVATTKMNDDGMNGGFGELFKFITGTNETKEKIAMTSPVLIDTANEKKTMSFIMPKASVEKGVPKPAANNVTLGKLDAARVVALRFPGSRNAKNETAAIEKLNAWIANEKLKGIGKPVFAYYDPPWTPVFMRRNEVMIRIEKRP